MLIDMPHRVHVNTPWLHVALALDKNSRFAGRMRPHILARWAALSELSRLESFTEEQRNEMRQRACDLSVKEASHYPASWWMIARNR